MTLWHPCVVDNNYVKYHTNLSDQYEDLDTNFSYVYTVSWLSWIGCLTSQLTIFQSYMWRQIQSYMLRHIDVQADRRRSWTYGRAPNAIDIS